MTDERREPTNTNPAGEISPTTHTGEGVNTGTREGRWRAPTLPTGLNRDWIHQANCHNTHGKYHLTPQNQQHQKHIQHAANLCKTCPVQTQCHEYITQLPQDQKYGIWAGTQYKDPNQPPGRGRKKAIKLI